MHRNGATEEKATIMLCMLICLRQERDWNSSLIGYRANMRTKEGTAQDYLARLSTK